MRRYGGQLKAQMPGRIKQAKEVVGRVMTGVQRRLGGLKRKGGRGRGGTMMRLSEAERRLVKQYRAKRAEAVGEEIGADITDFGDVAPPTALRRSSRARPRAVKSLPALGREGRAQA
jgi:hypothetical protein